MLTLKTLTAGTFALMVAASPAFALTINNMDKDERAVTIDHGTKEDQLKIPGGKSANADCAGVCAVRLSEGGTGHDTMAKTGDKLVIENSKISAQHSDRSAQN